MNLYVILGCNIEPTFTKFNSLFLVGEQWRRNSTSDSDDSTSSKWRYFDKQRVPEVETLLSRTGPPTLNDAEIAANIRSLNHKKDK